MTNTKRVSSLIVLCGVLLVSAACRDTSPLAPSPPPDRALEPLPENCHTEFFAFGKILVCDPT